jgi:hypothetical protein
VSGKQRRREAAWLHRAELAILLDGFRLIPLDGLSLRRRNHARWMASLLPLLAAGQPGTPPPRVSLAAADRRPADDLAPTVADVRAHATLTAAPPRSRVPVLAGAAA